MKRQQITTYEQAVEYIMNIPRFTTKNTPEDTRKFLSRLGEPDAGLRILHVAGTNGKGSVCAYLRSVLEAAGKKVAVFTSPHLVDVRERFLIGGEMISREAFLEVFLRVYEELDWKALEAGEGYHPTFFEYLFFMAMLAFSQAGPDYCVLETGLGGRLDATNAVTRKELAVITHISLDHVEYLGHTLAAIAGEKAGIIREGVPVVYAETCEEVAQVIRERARLLSAERYPVSRIDYRFSKIRNKNIDFSYISRYYGSISLTLPTFAGYQVENCSLAARFFWRKPWRCWRRKRERGRRRGQAFRVRPWNSPRKGWKRGYLSAFGPAAWKKCCRRSMWTALTTRTASGLFWNLWRRMGMRAAGICSLPRRRTRTIPPCCAGLWTAVCLKGCA